MDDEPEPLAGLLETYDVAIAELETLEDPATASLLASLRELRERAAGQANERSTRAYALHP